MSMKVGIDAASMAGLDAYIEKEMRRLKAPGLSIALVADGESLLEKGYGFADRAAGRRADEDTVFNVGSVSKLFTCAAILKLAEEGLVGLDAPVTDYIPELSALKTRGSSLAGITIRKMLCHHSGLPADIARGFTFGEGPAAARPGAYRELPSILAGTYVATAPGTVFSYSNLSFSLLGIVVERASGMGFEDYVQEAILKPCGMASSTFTLDGRFSERWAKGYTKGRKPVEVQAIRDLPAGQLSSTARDMASFLKAILASCSGEGGILRPETMAEALRLQNAGIGLDFGFGIGLTWWLMELPELPGLAIAGHGGDLPPFHSLLLIAPEKGIGIEINVNNAVGMGSMELKGIAAEALRLAFRMKGGADPFVVVEKAAATPLPPEIDASVEGWYSSMLGLLRLERFKGRLRLRLKGLWLEAIHHADGRYSLSFRLFGLIPIRVPLLEGVSFRIERLGDKPWIAFEMKGIPYGCAERIEPEPIPPEWLSRCGRYGIQNPEAGLAADGGARGNAARKAGGRFALRRDGKSGFLFLDYSMFGSAASYPIRPLGPDEFVTWGMGRNMNETGIFQKAGGGTDGPASETLSFSGFVLKKEQLR
jgi:CubicO group peptidase (beta-lactamase class C family)